MRDRRLLTSVVLLSLLRFALNQNLPHSPQHHPPVRTTIFELAIVRACHHCETSPLPIVWYLLSSGWDTTTPINTSNTTPLNLKCPYEAPYISQNQSQNSLLWQLRDPWSHALSSSKIRHSLATLNPAAVQHGRTCLKNLSFDYPTRSQRHIDGCHSILRSWSISCLVFAVIAIYRSIADHTNIALSLGTVTDVCCWSISSCILSHLVLMLKASTTQIGQGSAAWHICLRHWLKTNWESQRVGELASSTRTLAWVQNQCS